MGLRNQTIDVSMWITGGYEKKKRKIYYTNGCTELFLIYKMLFLDAHHRDVLHTLLIIALSQRRGIQISKYQYSN